jgi:hypothetical protein
MISHPKPVPEICGAERDRTDDLRLAKPALSQLSYSPDAITNAVGQGRLELPTSRLSGVRSNHLSYWPEAWLRSWLGYQKCGGYARRTWSRCLAPWKLNRTKLDCTDLACCVGL